MNNGFSEGDKKKADDRKVPSYVATPNGSLQEYDDKTKKTETVNTTDVPSDPNDPERLNKVDPNENKKDDPYVK
ncbi:DUF4329 domain-containing protein [candidate division KSB1 bacterium]|nr:DUF4329 domain-containing protein [candidate division KSB1 bacterium]